jgi:hypothetical protein
MGKVKRHLMLIQLFLRRYISSWKYPQVLERTKLAHKIAQEQTKAKMLDTSKELLLASTSNLSAQDLAERDKALEGMRRVLFATDN